MKKLMIALALFMMLTGSVIAADPVVLKMGTFEPPGGWGNAYVWAPLIEDFNKVAPEVVKIKFYTGGTLGKNPLTYLKLVTDGVIDMGWVMNPYYPGRFKDDMVSYFPFIDKNVYEVALSMQRMYKKGLLSGYDDLYVLAMAPTNELNLHTNFPVKSPDDLKGKKIRAAGKIQFELLKAAGATPVPIPITKVAESISRGVIDGGVTEPLAMSAFRIDDVARYHTMVPFGSVTVMYAMSKKKYQSLPANARAILDEQTGEKWVMKYCDENEKTRAKFIEKWKNDPKHNFYYPSTAELQDWKARFTPVMEAWKKENMNSELLIKAYMDEINKIRASK